MPHQVVRNAMHENSDFTANYVSSRAVLSVVDSTMTFSEQSLKTSQAAATHNKVANLFGQSDKDSDDFPLSVVTADVQTAGTGRLGRVWANQADKSFAGSFITALPSEILHEVGVGWMTTMAGLSTIEALKTLDPEIPVQLKWPNDLFVEGKKLGGILSRLVSTEESGKTEVLIFGIGLNLFMDPSELPIENATSLHQWIDTTASHVPGGHPLEENAHLRYLSMRERLVESIATALNSWLQKMQQNPRTTREVLRELAREYSATIGKIARVRLTSGENFEGLALDIDSDAALIVQQDSGSARAVSTADVGIGEEASKGEQWRKY